MASKQGHRAVSGDQSPAREKPARRWPHWLACALACTVFALIWVGGLVTTYNAGMAVPDWPTTYGHWFYPLQRWLWRWSPVLLEHGHRTLAQLVGLLSIALAAALWRLDDRRGMRWLAGALLAGVLLQGTLGGFRVLRNLRLLAMVHACTAPLLFALSAAVVTLTSRAWREKGGKGTSPLGVAGAKDLFPIRSCLAAVAGIYLMIVMGALLRHLSPEGSPGWFQWLVWTKLCVAAVMAGLLVSLFYQVRRTLRHEPMITRRAALLLALFPVQLVLAGATWVTRWGWPAWFTQYVWHVPYTVVADGRVQALARTAHAAVGSLTLVAALSLLMWSRRRLPI